MTSEARASASPPPEAAPAAKGEKKDKTEIDTKAADEVKSDVGEATAANEAQDSERDITSVFAQYADSEFL